MKLVVNNIELETSELDGLIFAASNIAARAKACKTYTIEIPATSRNTQALGDIWTVHELRSYKFTAYMRTDTIDIPGVLIIDSFNRYSASGNFVFGVGIVGSLLEGVRLRDVDFSELDHDIADFADSYCDGSLDYVYDLGSRGLYKGAAVAVDEVYPAYNCKKLLEILLSGYNPDLSDVDDSLFTIFTGDHEFNNDRDWQKKAVFDVVIDDDINSQNHEIITTPQQVNSIVVIDKSPTGTNPGGYLGTTNIFTVPETGVYQLEVSYDLNILITWPGGQSPDFQFPVGTNNGMRIKFQIYGESGATTCQKVVDIVGTQRGEWQHSGSFTSYLRTAPAGSTYKLRVDLEYYVINMAGGGDITTRLTSDVDYICKNSRYFGYGSTVEAKYLLPDIAATDYIKWLCNVMNLLIYADPLINDIRVVRQAARGAVGTLELDQIEQTIEARKEFQLVFDNDDASGLDEVISFPVLDYGEISDYKTGIARTSIGLNTQVSGTAVPILIQENDKWETKLNARVLQLTGSESETWQLELFEAVYTGLTAIDKVPTWSEIDYESLFVQAANRGIRIIEGVGRLLPEMYTVERYLFPVNVKDIRTDELLGYGYIVKAEQVSGDVYKYTIEI